MWFFPTWEIAIARMKRRGTTKVSWHRPHNGDYIEYSYIHATAVRNWDGTPAGDGQANRSVLQRKTIREDGSTRWENKW